MKSALCRLTAVLLLLLLTINPSWACAESEEVPDLKARFASESDIEYNGTLYRMRKRLTTVLLAGTDMVSEAYEQITGFRSGAQADFLLLLVIDDNRDTVLPIQINRDTITEITVLSVLGKASGTRDAQICLAHSFGDGGEQSCELLCDAVSGLMHDVPVDHYMVLSLDGIAAFNDALGGVEVTLEDDFSAFDPAMTQGTTLTLVGKQAEYYVRQRFYVGEQTNISRMDRQQEYMTRAIEQLRSAVSADTGSISDFIAGLDQYLTTDMNRGKLLNLASKISDYEYLPFVSVEGESVVSERGFMEYYADEEALLNLVLDAFYAPAE